MKLLMCGGREFGIILPSIHPLYEQKLQERNKAFAMLSEMTSSFKLQDLLIIHGAARGADTLVEIWAKQNNIKTKSLPADWKKYGRAAGPIRNREMLKERPDEVWAFPGGNGTKDMLDIAKKSGIKTKIIM